VAVAPSAPATVYAGQSTALFKSTDGGATWTAGASWAAVLGGSTRVITLVVDPGTPATVYAATQSTICSGRFCAGGFDVLKSTNGGASWTSVLQGCCALAIDPSSPATLYAGVGTGYRVVKSTDGGATWNPTGLTFTSDNVQALLIDPVTPATLYAGTARE